MTKREFDQIVVALQQLYCIGFGKDPYIPAEAVLKILASHVDAEPFTDTVQFKALNR